MCYKYHNRITTQKHTTTRLQGYDVAPICSIYNSVIKAEREETETRERQLEICLCLIFSLHSSSSENIVFIWRSPPKLFEEKYLNKSGDKKKRAQEQSEWRMGKLTTTEQPQLAKPRASAEEKLTAQKKR